MPVKSDDPLRKCTLNLYEADCQWMEAEYGHGWTERLRQHLHSLVHERKIISNRANAHINKNIKRILGDLSDD